MARANRTHQLNKCDICAGKSNPGGDVTEEMVDDIRATERKASKSKTRVLKCPGNHPPWRTLSEPWTECWS